MGYLTDLTDEQWTWIEPIFPPQEGPGRRRTVSLRRVIDALMYQDRSGCQWRMIPLDFPPSGTVRYYFDKWNEDGTMLEIHDCLRRAVRVQQGREPEPIGLDRYGSLLAPAAPLPVLLDSLRPPSHSIIPLQRAQLPAHS